MSARSAKLLVILSVAAIAVAGARSLHAQRDPEPENDPIRLTESADSAHWQTSAVNVPARVIQELLRSDFHITGERLDDTCARFLGFRGITVETRLCRTRYPVHTGDVQPIVQRAHGAGGARLWKAGKELAYMDGLINQEPDRWFPIQRGIVVTAERHPGAAATAASYTASYPVDRSYLARLNRKYWKGEASAFVFRSLEIDGDFRPALYAPAPSAITFNAELPANAHLAFGFGVLEEGWADSDGIVFSVSVQPKGGSEETVFSQTVQLRSDARAGRWRDTHVDLSAYAGKNVALTFRTGAGKGNGFDFGAFGSAVIYSPRSHATPVILIDVDTLRADHLQTYGYERPTSPVIEQLARESVVFDAAIAQAPWTLPSQMSILTGLHPATHRVQRPSDSLASGIPTLASQLRDHGYFTKAIADGVAMSAAFGFDVGFDSYSDWTGHGSNEDFLSGSLQRFGAWFDGFTESNFFLLLHTYECHAAYAPPDEDRRTFDGGYAGDIFQRFRPRGGPSGSVSKADLQHLIDRYDGEIRYVDRSIGKILALLKEKKLYDSAIIILLSDHGEEFLDHGSWLHQNTLYDEMIRVPLIVKFPKGAVAPSRVSQQIETVDLLPTILDFLGIPVPSGLDGISRLSLIQPNNGGPENQAQRFAFSDLDGTVSVRSPTHKLIAGRSGRLFFSLVEDPKEQRNLYDADDAIVRQFEAALTAYLGQKPKQNKAASRHPSLDPSTKRQLEMLGYGDEE